VIAGRNWGKPLKDFSEDSRYQICGIDLVTGLYYGFLRRDKVWYVSNSVSQEPTASIFVVCRQPGADTFCIEAQSATVTLTRLTFDVSVEWVPFWTIWDASYSSLGWLETLFSLDVICLHKSTLWRASHSNMTVMTSSEMPLHNFRNRENGEVWDFTAVFAEDENFLGRDDQ
jgi:hypothetical protein